METILKYLAVAIVAGGPWLLICMAISWIAFDDD